MDRSAASGERTALRGYRWQYDQLASVVYDSLLDQTFISLRLSDPAVGKVDDLVLVTNEGSVGHQFKSEEPAGSITFNDLLRPRRTRSGKPAPSWLQALGEGWLALGGASAKASVSLVTNRWPSVNDHVPASEDVDRPAPDNFATFFRQVLEPIARGEITLPGVPRAWGGAMERMRAELGFAPEQFEGFLRALRLELARPDPLRTPDLVRRRDIQELSDALYRKVSNSVGVVVLDRQELLEAVGWSGRVRLRSTHEFPVDLDTYEPLDAAIDSLVALLDRTSRGYLALIGPPGSGKSTLLTQSLSLSNDRIVRYYAYIPGPGTTRTRFEGRGFLHDMVLMLERTTSSRSHLLERSEQELREAFVILLEKVAFDYRQSGRKTLIVVDGLDHVERDQPGPDSLLHELPRPEEIPEGVVFLVGTRTLTPLRPEARHHIEDEGRLLNLDAHRLPHHAVLAICQRIGSIAELGQQVHERVAQLAAGHPLSLAYLLNILVDASDASQALERLSEYPAYTGDVAQQYRAIWESIESRPHAQELLAIVARLRIPFTMEDLQSWFEPSTRRTFREELAYLFRAVGPSRSIFHDSFRQFVIAQSNTTDGPQSDPNWDADYHGRIADLCTIATRPAVQWEELYHRHRSGQNVLHLANQKRFREQVTTMRSSGTVREDLAIVMRAASDHRNLLAFIDAALAKSEAESRWSELVEVDVAAAFIDAGLPAEAVAYSGIEQGRRIPLAQAYRLASRLGLRGSADGRRVFDAAEAALFDDADFRVYAGQENDVYYEWAYAAPMYRALPKVLATAEVLHPGGRAEANDFRRRERVVRFSQVIDHIIDSLAALGRHPELAEVDELLVRMLAAYHHADDEGDGRFHLTDSRLRILECRVAAATDQEESATILGDGLTLATSVGLYLDTLLSWAELALQFDRTDEAGALLSRTRLDAQMDTSDLGYSKDGAIAQRFRYWRLRHRLLRRREGTRSEDALASVPPDESTPAGNSITPSAPVHGDRDAIELARTYDTFVRTLAAVAAATDEGAAYDPSRLTTTIIPMLDASRHVGHGSGTLSGLRTHRTEILQLVVGVVLDHSVASASALASRIGSRIEEETQQWPITLRLTLGEQLHLGGVTPDWYRPTLAAAEVEISSGDLDINSRLERAVELVRHYVGLDDVEDAQRLALMLAHLSFGVGYRKDYQFDKWVNWLHRAVAAGMADPISEAVALGHLLTATAPMTEGAPREAAAALPSVLVARHPAAAIALFEQLVRKGTVRHLDALAQLMAGLSRQLDARPVVLNAAVDVVTDILARCATLAYPDAVKSILGQCTAQLGSAVSATIREEMRARIERDALPTTRPGWLEALGVPRPPTSNPDDDDDRWGGLDLRDGTHLSQREAAAQITDAASLIKLREAATSDSTFGWAQTIARIAFTTLELGEVAALFNTDASHSDADVQVALGRHWLEHDDRDAALACADAALDSADENSWGYAFGTSRRDAHMLAIHAGGDAERQRAWRDLSEGVGDARWRADIILRELDSIVEMLDPTASPVDIWPLIRIHLAGMATNLDLDVEDPLEYQPIRWWYPGNSASVNRLDVDSTAAHALAVLVLDHATHFQWLVRDPAIAIASRALEAQYPEVESAIETVLGAEPSDEIIEALGRAVGASGTGPGTSPTLSRIHSVLGNHDNQFVRELSGITMTGYKPLPPRYRLHLPPGGARVLGATDLTLGPYEGVVRLCAVAADLDDDVIVEHALTLIREHRDELPTDRDALDALAAADMNFLLPYLHLFTSRSVAGRIVRDFRAAGHLDNLSIADQRLLRSFDRALIGMRPGRRPTLAPPPPPAGHDTTLKRWIAGTPARLEEYIEALGAADGYVVAAKAQATVLNWTHAEEEFVCSTVLGRLSEEDGLARPMAVYNRLKSDLSEPAPSREPRNGEAIAIENVAMYHQVETDWISFAPWVAAHLGWTPVPQETGTWSTTDGDIAIRVVEWVDGWPGHGDRAFDDTEGAGSLVVATAAGVEALREFGLLTRISQLRRRGRAGSGETETADRHVEQRAEIIDLLDGGNAGNDV